MKEKIFNGLSMLGIAMTATGLINTASGWGKWFLGIAAILLSIIGLMEIYGGGR